MEDVKGLIDLNWNLAYKYSRKKALDELIDELKKIDVCEFAMFSLCCIEEIVDGLKENLEDA